MRFSYRDIFSQRWWRSRREPTNHHAWRRRAYQLHYNCGGGSSYGAAVDWTFRTWCALRDAFLSDTTGREQTLSIFAGGKTRVWTRA